MAGLCYLPTRKCGLSRQLSLAKVVPALQMFVSELSIGVTHCRSWCPREESQEQILELIYIYIDLLFVRESLAVRGIRIGDDGQIDKRQW